VNAASALAAVAFAATAAALARAQEPQAPTAAQAATPVWVAESNLTQSLVRDDYREWHFFGGFRFALPGLDVAIRGGNALALTDLEESPAKAPARDAGGLRREPAAPDPRRHVSESELQERLTRALRAVGDAAAQPLAGREQRLRDLPRLLYCEDGVVVVREGAQVLRCDRLWLSPLDDRVVVENVELRYVTKTPRGEDALVVRGPRLVKQGGRWVGRNVTMTTCAAGEPHVALAVDELEILERDGEFEVVARGQSLQLGGASVLPLPDARVFTASQSTFPIRSLRAGWSQRLGAEGEVVFGLPWNASGGAVHEWLTGRPASEFRGDAELGVGWIETRGAPLDAAIEYRGGKLYEGKTEAFWLDDKGTDLREIQSRRDGSDIPPGQRGLVRTQNRFRLGPQTTLDAVAFYASDPGVYSEFFGGAYRTEEVPETSGYLRHAAGNQLFTVGTRFNLSEFSYRDDRALAQRFVEESPVVTWQLLAQPIAATPWNSPVVLDLQTEVGQRRSDYDDLDQGADPGRLRLPDLAYRPAPLRPAGREQDRTLRFDQLVELSAPFHIAGLNVRPYGSVRGTWYDRTNDNFGGDGGREGRVASTGGVDIGTRFSRTWKWIDDGATKGLRHVVAPRVRWLDRFHVDDAAAEFFAFDDLDRLGEEQLVRVEIRNLLQSTDGNADKNLPRDVVFFDVAQDMFPDAARDNEGQDLGLFRYDFLVRPRLPNMPFERVGFGVYGDHDWRDGLRTLDAELQLGPILGLDWTASYRADATVDGAVGLMASAQLLGRWNVFAGSQRDLDRDEWLAYRFGLRRIDHDWIIETGASYNPFADQVTFTIDFLPQLGSFSSPRNSRFGGDDGLDRPGATASSY